MRTLPSTVRPSQAARPPARARMQPGSLPFWMGLVLSILWAGLVFLVIVGAGPAHMFIGVPLAEWAVGITAVVAPVALIWMVAAYLQRAADIQSVAEPLRRQLAMITGESGVAEARMRRFNQAMREQLDLLKSVQSTGRDDFAGLIEQVREHKVDLEDFEQHGVEQVKQIQDIVRRNMQHVEQLMEDKFTMMRILDDKLVQNGDSVARQVEGTRDQIARMIDDIETNTRQWTEALDQALTNGKKLADTSRMQETSLLNAAESAAEMLGGVSSKIDLSIARFLE
ncbi:MAG TPA: hypothetical protein VMV79_08505, partial [Alphaproteobacteria bacterium]|nr:hypothetical protein [Alphaproteobacteria bacterium]